MPTIDIHPALQHFRDTIDFQDGYGPVPAHRHNGRVDGGWIADTARVHNWAVIPGTARVGSFSHVKEAKLAPGVCIGANCTIGDRVGIGKDVQIKNSVDIKDDVWIAEMTKIGSCITIDEFVFIGPRVCIDSHVSIAHSVKISEDCHVARYTAIFPRVFLDAAVDVGQRVTLHSGVSIGEKTLVGMQASVACGIAVGPNRVIRQCDIIDGNTLRSITMRSARNSIAGTSGK